MTEVGAGELLRDVEDLAATDAGTWFPGLRARTTSVTVLATRSRPRCVLHWLRLDDGTRFEDVVLKVRRDDPGARRHDPFEERRPALAPERVVSSQEAAVREHAGLAVAAAVAGSAPDRFGAVRPLAVLPRHSALVVDAVAAPTVKDLVQLRARRPWSPDAQPPDAVWSGLGEWLRRFHTAGLDGLPLLTRLTSTEQLVHQAQAAGAFLAQLGASGGATRLAEAVARAVPDVLRGPLSCAVGHGDFVAQNVFALADGRLAVFDPMPLWRVCVLEDLARLTVGLRLLPVRTLSGGSMLPPRRLLHWDRVVVQSYFGAPEVPWAAFAAYQGLVLLDRWGELLSKRPHGGRVRLGVRRVQVAAVAHVFDYEAHRIVRLLG